MPLDGLSEHAIALPLDHSPSIRTSQVEPITLLATGQSEYLQEMRILLVVYRKTNRYSAAIRCETSIDWFPFGFELSQCQGSFPAATLDHLHGIKSSMKAKPSTIRRERMTVYYVHSLSTKGAHFV
jgi:hypothetical protein